MNQGLVRTPWEPPEILADARGEPNVLWYLWDAIGESGPRHVRRLARSGDTLFVTWSDGPIGVLRICPS